MLSKRKKQLNDFTEFMELCSVVIITAFTAEIYAEMRAALHRKGNPIPTNDVWIAESAIQHNLIVATKDKHFKEIEGLDVEFW